MKIARAQVYAYTLPFREPVRLRRATLTERHGLLLQITDVNGAEGWGEAAPLPGFSREDFDTAKARLLQLASSLPGRTMDFENGLLAGDLDAANALPASVSFAFEAACLHAIAAGLGQSLSACLSQGAVSEIPVNALLTGDETCIAAQAQAARDVGYTAAKIKVGATDIDADVGRVRMARAILGDAVSLRADANRAWAWDAAVVFARSAGALLEYIEEPLDEPARLPEFTDATGLAYAVDETFQDWAVRQSPFDDSLPWNAIAEHAIATIWKPTLSHGINWRADFAARTGWPVQRLVYSAAFESGIGIATIAEYASAQALPRCPAGLDTYTRLAEDISSKPLRFEHGLLLLDAAAHRDAIDTQRLTLLLNAGQS